VALMSENADGHASTPKHCTKEMLFVGPDAEVGVVLWVSSRAFTRPRR
jgi:hypothetical protein